MANTTLIDYTPIDAIHLCLIGVVIHGMFGYCSLELIHMSAGRVAETSRSSCTAQRWKGVVKHVVSYHGHMPSRPVVINS